MGYLVSGFAAASRAQSTRAADYDVPRTMEHPLIAVTAANQPDKRGFDRASLNLSYLRAIEAAGGVPLLLSPGMTPERIAAALAQASGLILTGGGDVDPARYGATPHETIIGVSESRDTMEVEALREADALGLPVLAICRGMQVLNVARGGTLLQDIPSMVSGACQHSIQDPREGPAHAVAIDAGTRLAGIAGTAYEVNSRHHQAVDRLGEGLTITAHAPDGVVEALEAPGERFLVGVQWHPEDMAGRFESADRLFAAFAAAARAHGKG